MARVHNTRLRLILLRWEHFGFKSHAFLAEPFALIGFRIINLPGGKSSRILRANLHFSSLVSWEPGSAFVAKPVGIQAALTNP